MDEIKPVAWMCNAHVFFMEGNAKDYALDVEMPVFGVYDQQAIDSLRAEVERLAKLCNELGNDWVSEMEACKRAEAEADALRELCRDMLPVFEAARPLVLNLERLRDAAKQGAE